VAQLQVCVQSWVTFDFWAWCFSLFVRQETSESVW
jgi:hypothetical protein